MLNITERALPALHAMQRQEQDDKAFRVVFKGFG